MNIRALFACLLFAPLLSSAAIITYPNPNSISTTPASEYSVTGDGTSVGVYDLLCTNGSGTTNFRVARFAFANANNPCRVYVQYNNTSAIDPQAPGIQSYTVTPASAVDDVHTTTANTLTFRLLHPANIEVSINGGTTQDTDAHASQLLYIFADAPQSSPESTWTVQSHPSNVYYFGSGDNSPPSGAIMNGSTWVLDPATDSHNAIYLAPGAVLNANIAIQNSKLGNATTPSFKIYGPGYIRDTSRAAAIVSVRDSTYVTIQDVCLFNAKVFSLHLDATKLGDSNNITVKNVRTLGIEVNSDALQLCGPIHDSVIQNCFLVGNDNLIVFGGGSNNSLYTGPHDIRVQSCTFAKSRYAGNWFFAQGNSVTDTNPTPGGEIGGNNVFSDCEIIRLNTDQVGLVTDWWGDLRNVGNASATGILIANLQVDSMAQYQYGSASSSSPYLNNVVSLGMAALHQSDLAPVNSPLNATERPTTDSSGNSYIRSLTLRNVYLPTLSSPQANYVKSNWNVTFDHVYVNNVPVTSNGDLSLTKGANATVTYKYTFPPTGVTATAKSGTQVDLSWNASRTTETLQGYNVYWSLSATGPWTKDNSSPITGTAYSDTGAQQGTTYYYLVTAVDSVTESPDSSMVSVTTPIDVIGVTLAPPTGSDGTLLTTGSPLQFTATVSPANATNKSVTWSSNNTAVATVDANGVVRAVAPGAAKITVRTADKGFTAYYQVAVVYPASSASCAGGTVIATNHVGALSGSFADFSTSGSTLTFSNVDGGAGGSSRILIRYSMANGPRTGTLTVNGVAQSMTFSQTTADWDTWTTASVTVSGITAGNTNTIKFSTTGTDFPNIDYIGVFD